MFTKYELSTLVGHTVVYAVHTQRKMYIIPKPYVFVLIHLNVFKNIKFTAIVFVDDKTHGLKCCIETYV